MTVLVTRISERIIDHFNCGDSRQWPCRNEASSVRTDL